MSQNVEKSGRFRRWLKEEAWGRVARGGIWKIQFPLIWCKGDGKPTRKEQDFNEWIIANFCTTRSGPNPEPIPSLSGSNPVDPSFLSQFRFFARKLSSKKKFYLHYLQDVIKWDIMNKRWGNVMSCNVPCHCLGEGGEGWIGWRVFRLSFLSLRTSCPWVFFLDNFSSFIFNFFFLWTFFFLCDNCDTISFSRRCHDKAIRGGTPPRQI